MWNHERIYSTGREFFILLRIFPTKLRDAVTPKSLGIGAGFYIERKFNKLTFLMSSSASAQRQAVLLSGRRSLEEEHGRLR
jgi:hypothetical protein